MDTLTELKASLDVIEQNLHYTFQDKNLLVLAFTHRSFVNEHSDLISEDNQRLEFLGDSVLGAVAADYLYRSYPEEPEGKLSPLKASIVEAVACGEYINILDVEEFLLLGKGELKCSGRGRESLLADLFEAIVGAIYLDAGYVSAKEFILSNFLSKIEEILYNPAQNYKALLQNTLQKNGKPQPVYYVVKEWGPAHEKMFHVAVSVEDEILGEGDGPSKKMAESHAAKIAYEKIIIDQEENK